MIAEQLRRAEAKYGHDHYFRQFFCTHYQKVYEIVDPEYLYPQSFAPEITLNSVYPPAPRKFKCAVKCRNCGKNLPNETK